MLCDRHPFHRAFLVDRHAFNHHHHPGGTHRGVFRALDEEFQKMREGFDRAWRGDLSVVPRGTPTLRGFAAADIQETEKALSLKVDLPGLKKQDIKVMFV